MKIDSISLDPSHSVEVRSSNIPLEKSEKVENLILNTNLFKAIEKKELLNPLPFSSLGEQKV